jgi:ABC-2 type transport system permease protein
MGPAEGFLQFLELARQFGLLAVVLVYMGIVAGERRDGLLVTVLVKPVSRLAYLTSRWLVNGAYVLASFVLGTGVAVLYTYLLLGRPDLGAALAAGGLYLTYMLLAFSWTTAFSSLTRSAGIAAGLALIPLFALPVIGYLWSPLGEYGPYGAVAAGTAALGMAQTATEAVPWSALVSAGVNVAGSLALLGASFLAIRRAEL